MISVVINTFNEEKNLPNALASVKDLADEIVVVDMHSDDKTAAIAKKFGAKVYQHERTNYVEPARNFAISKATGDWILILDADEEVPVLLAKKLKKLAELEEKQIYRIPRKNIIFGKWMKYSRWWPDHNIRFFKKGTVVWDDQIHSVPITSGDSTELEADEKLALVHYNYQTIEQFVDRLNRYSTIQAERLVKNNKYHFVWSDLLKRPIAEFLSRFFAGEGYKDGIHGLALANLQAFSELIVYLKVWQLEKFRLEDLELEKVVAQMKTLEKDSHYWQADSLTKQTGKLKHKIKRKFKLG